MSRFVRSWSATSRSLPQFAPARRPQSRRRFTLERLEGRSLLSTVHLTVNTLADDPTAPVAGQTTLRDAITAADAGSTANKYVIKFAVDGTIALTSVLPNLTNNIVIKGPGAGELAIEPELTAGLFHTFQIGSNTQYGQGVFPDVKITGLTIKNGGNGTNTINTTAGGIFNLGNATIKNCVFIGNTGVFGGGIVNDTTMTVSSCLFYGNGNSQSAGTAIESNDGSLSILKNDVFSENFGGGGAIDNNGTMVVHGCSFIGNLALHNAGAIFNWGVLTVDASLFVDNFAGIFGGAIVNEAFLTLTNSTFSGNTATLGADIYNAGTATICS